MGKKIQDFGAYITSDEAAELTGYDVAHIRLLCRQGKIPGAVKRGRDWLMPQKSVESYKPGPKGFAARAGRKPDGGKEGR